MMQLFDEVTSMLVSMIPMAQEFYLLCFFCLGFALFRTEAMQRRLCSQGARKAVDSTGSDDETEQSFCSLKQYRKNFEQRHYVQVVDGWAKLEQYTPEAFTWVVLALIEIGSADDVGMFMAKVLANLPHLKPFLHETLRAIAEPDVEVSWTHAEKALRDIVQQLGDDLSCPSIEVLLHAFARHNDELRVSKLLQQLATQNALVTSETLAKIVQGFVECKNLDAALGYWQQMIATKAPASPDLLVMMVRSATQDTVADEAASGAARPRVWDLLDIFQGDHVDLPNEAAVLLLEWAACRDPVDLKMADSVEHLLRAQGSGSMPSSAYDAAIRIHAGPGGDVSKARSMFHELTKMVDNGWPASEASLLGMLVACSDSPRVCLAEQIFAFVQLHRRCTVRIFAAVVKVLSNGKHFERICELYEDVAKQRLTLDDALYGQLIKVAVQVGKLDLARSLFKEAANPDVQNYMSLMRASGQEGNVQEVLEMLKELQARGEADTLAFNCALDVCVTCGDQESASAVFKDMDAAGQVDVISYNILLKQHTGEGGACVEIDTLLKDMRKRGLKPNTSTYNSLLGASLAAGHVEKAWQTIAVMEASGQVDAYTVSILFKGFRRDRYNNCDESISAALKLIAKHSVRMDEVLVSTCLEACLCSRNVRLLKTALDIFARNGWAVPRHCAMHTYALLIKAYGQTQNLDTAWRLWRVVTEERSLVPSEQLYGQMIDVLVANDHLDSALQLLAKMKAAYSDRLSSPGFAVAYAMIIRGFAQLKECDRALACYEEMKQVGAKASLVIFNTLIDACSRVGNIDEAAKLYQEMVDEQCVPDLITYSTLIKGFCVRGDLDQAMQLFSLMKQKGIKPDAIVFNSLLDGCAKKQMPALCEQVMQDMLNVGVSLSNHTASILIKVYGRSQDIDAAFRVVDEMPKKYGFRPNAAVYTCLMSTCIANHRLDLAMDLRERMVQEKAYPDERTYSTLLRGALRSGSVEQCVLLIEAALDQDGRRLLDAELVQSVLMLVQKRRLWTIHGQALFERLRHAGIGVRSPPEASQSYDKNSTGGKQNASDGRPPQRRRGAEFPRRAAGA